MARGYLDGLEDCMTAQVLKENCKNCESLIYFYMVTFRCLILGLAFCLLSCPITKAIFSLVSQDKYISLLISCW